VKLKSKIFWWYAALVAAFVAITLLPAPDHTTLTKYHLSATGLRLLDITIILPEAAIWYAAFYGYEKLYIYRKAIGNGVESLSIAKLARGLLFLSIGLPAVNILSGILGLIARHNASFDAASVIITNYANVVFPLIAFLYISLGARRLSNLRKTRPRLIMIHAVVLTTIVLGVVFCSLIAADHRELRLTYHMSPELVMLTLAIPYMYIWFLGLQASSELQAYSKRVVGVFYRKGWNMFTAGLVGIIFTSILLQYLSTLYSWLTSLSLGWLLVLLYVLLFLLSAAYIVMALGAKKLMKIEEA
jgi:hypothetical protein